MARKSKWPNATASEISRKLCRQLKRINAPINTLRSWRVQEGATAEEDKSDTNPSKTNKWLPVLCKFKPNIPATSRTNWQHRFH